MFKNLVLAITITLTIPCILLQAYIIMTDNRLLDAINGLRRGMSVEEAAAVLKADVSSRMHENNISEHPAEKFVFRMYMGYFTSRNLLVFFDDAKRVSYVGWERT